MDKDKIVDELYAMLEGLPKQPSSLDLEYMAEDLADWYMENAKEIVRKTIAVKEKMEKEEKAVVDEKSTKLKKPKAKKDQSDK